MDELLKTPEKGASAQENTSLHQKSACAAISGWAHSWILCQRNDTLHTLSPPNPNMIPPIPVPASPHPPAKYIYFPFPEKSKCLPYILPLDPASLGLWIVVWLLFT